MEQTIEDLKNKDIQIELRKKYYDDLSLKKKQIGQKGYYSSTLCYCNRFHYNRTATKVRHTWSKKHQDYCIKIKNEEKIIKEKNPKYLLTESDFHYKNQIIQYYYFS